MLGDARQQDSAARPDEGQQGGAGGAAGAAVAGEENCRVPDSSSSSPLLRPAGRELELEISAGRLLHQADTAPSGTRPWQLEEEEEEEEEWWEEADWTRLGDRLFVIFTTAIFVISIIALFWIMNSGVMEH